MKSREATRITIQPKWNDAQQNCVYLIGYAVLNTDGRLTFFSNFKHFEQRVFNTFSKQMR